MESEHQNQSIMLSSISFVAIALLSIAMAARQFMKVRRNILLGQAEEIPGEQALRWRNVLLVAFGQQKMFKNALPAILHLFIYVAFVITQIELIEIFIDGIFGTHRFFAPSLGGFYTFIISFIEVLSALALIATFVFLVRRNVLHIARFQKPELKGWPAKDANVILYLEIALIFCIFLMNSADMALHQNSYSFALSRYISPVWQDFPAASLHLLERIGWWGHVLVVFAFLNYLPVSKHLHILLAFPNTWYAPQRPRGEMENMPAIMQEVKSMLGLSDATATAEVPDFGAGDVPAMSWKNILDAYSCTECGRCTAVCPANSTGKKLSPRKVVMSIRDRAEEIGRKIDSGDMTYAKDAAKALDAANFQDGKSLFDYISPEEIHACTTCNACVEACPVLINPLDPILKMRRYEILTLSQGPSDWLPMFNSMENSGAAWAMSTPRDQWTKELSA